MFFGFWNIRGILDPLRRAELRRFIAINKLSLVGVLETKVPEESFESISSTLVRGWKWIANYNSSPRGRIWVGWNPDLVSFCPISISDQVIHGSITCSTSGLVCSVSTVYGEHSFVRRRPLWEDLQLYSETFLDVPWLVAGDFNAIKDPSDRVGGATNWIPCFDEFGQCLEQTDLVDLRYVGLRYSWSTSAGNLKKLRKIDRALVNNEWNLRFSYSEASFLTPGISDHSPITVKVLQQPHRRKPFKYFQCWEHHPDFKSIVQQTWDTPVSGYPMFQLVSKLKMLKTRLRTLNKDSFSDISCRTEEARVAHSVLHAQLQENPSDLQLVDMERGSRITFIELRKQEESLYRQKSRINWLKEGDKNTKFFHHSVKRRQLINRIITVRDSAGFLITDPMRVPQVFINFFSTLLAPNETVSKPTPHEIQKVIRRPLCEDQIRTLDGPVSDAVIKDTVFSLAKGKAPGPDGFSVEFFRSNWEIVGPLVVLAVRDFFQTGKLLKEVNTTILTLIPKIPNATSVSDFRPIACCNTIYKVITKILANRLAMVLNDLVSQSQNAFVKGRRIRDNILLAQELFAGFHLRPYLPKCAVKVDFHKAYDTVDWDFLENVLLAFRFPHGFVRLVMACVRTPYFSIAINGDLHGFFPSGRGLRQGDPMSPYLFTLVMEIFSGILNSRTANHDFKYYWRCKSVHLSHLFFADDVFLFSQADWLSVTMLKRGLDIFSSWSGLFPNKSKSEIFLSGGDLSIRNKILWAFGFQEGKLPVRYLGVPIISSKLTKADCIALTDRITARIQSWAHRFLSFAGRLQLVRSVLHSIQAFWTSVFTLPASVIASVERIMRQFLWKGAALGRGGAKVAWEEVCRPKSEGGLGIRNLKDCNRASMLKFIWILFVDRESLWCRWIHSVFLTRKNFWNASQPGTCSWSWKKILQLRGQFRTSFRWKIGNGCSASLWHDFWLPCGPLDVFVPLSFRSNLNMPKHAVVADLFTPRGLLTRNFLTRWGITLPVLSECNDRFIWCEHSSGVFSVMSAWNFTRSKKPPVCWAPLIWDNDIVPRHQFILWLIAKKRLPTQVMLLSYGRIDYHVCAFCSETPDSIDHLYFGCRTSASLAFFWAARCNLPWRNRCWDEVLAWAKIFLSGKSFYHRIARYSFGALCYLIWKKRNAMIFRGEPLAVPAIKNHLIKMVKDKVITFKNVEPSPRNRRLQRGWGFDPAVFSTEADAPV